MAKRVRPSAGRATRKPRRHDRRPVKSSADPAKVRAAQFSPPQYLPRPDDQAVAILDRGMRELQRHSYQAAAEFFRAVLEQFPGERAIADRVRVYLTLCGRELDRRPPALITSEERLTAATAALNNGDDERAEPLVRSVLKEDPRNDLALYLMAAIAARHGDVDAAVSLLQRAASVSPEVRAQARHDPDFELLHHVEAFQTLIDPPAPSTRRAKRPRTAP
jgi:tetratricopeptide (TPR) repeat protein